MIAATEQPKERLCRACFDGVYPIELPEPELLGKHLLEDFAPVDVEGLRHPRRWRRVPPAP